MYYIEKDNKIVLFDENKQKIQTTLEFMPQYKDLEIQETDKNIVIFEGQYYLEDDEEYIEKKEQAERERINNLKMTKADFWIALLDKDITKEMVKEKIELIPDETLKAKTLIRLDDADNFWRGDPSMDVVGQMFGLTSSDLDYLFEHKELPSK
jgi:hypothetical protein